MRLNTSANLEFAPVLLKSKEQIQRASSSLNMHCSIWLQTLRSLFKRLLFSLQIIYRICLCPLVNSFREFKPLVRIYKWNRKLTGRLFYFKTEVLRSLDPTVCVCVCVQVDSKDDKIYCDFQTFETEHNQNSICISDVGSLVDTI